jgi:hypothetical protein
MTFPVEIINHATPQVTVTVSDPVSGGLQGVTYEALRRSLGAMVYWVKKLYLYSENFAQIGGTINYNRFDVNGNKEITNLVIAVDPNQTTNAIFLNLEKSFIPVIFNGNSSLSGTIQPNTTVLVRFYTERITNEFGMNLAQFMEQERIANKPNFYKDYGVEIPKLIASDKQKQAAILSGSGGGGGKKKEEKKEPFPWWILLLIAAGLYMVNKKDE